jgi:ketosteroid isomerase-like protein
MPASLQEITGNETLANDNGPLDALVSFYRAFNGRDIEALARNWAEGESPSMDNPVGGIRRGWASISQGYEKLFKGPANVRVAFHDFTSQGAGDWHLFVGREKGVCEVGDQRIELRIRTTRWFVKQEGRWRQWHHHGSIEEPGLLASYQTAIFGAPLLQPA